MPKTGGTSVVRWLQRHYRYDQVLHEASHWKGVIGRGMEAWSSKEFVRGHFSSYICRHFSPAKGYLPITVVRDPVQRVISQFWHMKRAEDAVAEQFAFIRDPKYSLEEFVDDPAVRGRAGSFQTTHLGFDLSRDMHHKEVVAVLRHGSHEDDGALERAKDFLRGCAAVGITEALPEFLDDLSAILHSPFARDLERARGYAPSRRGIDRALADRIRRNNEADYELYALARELARRRRSERLYCRITWPLRTRYALRPPLDLDEAREVQWSVDQPFFGSGWSDVQSYSDANTPLHRWTLGRRSSLWVRFKARRRYQLRISVLRFVSWAQVFRLRIGGQQVKLRRVAKDKAHGPGGGLYEGSFRVRSGGNVRVEFCVNNPLSFGVIDSKSRDRTRRGLAIRWVQFAEDGA